MSARTGLLSLAAAALLAASAGTAAADKADALFTKGKALLAKKQYAEACSTFEKVDELDPGIGAKLNVARCYEEWGKLVAAHRWYSDAEKMARKAGDDRAPKIKKLVAELEPDVPRLTISLADGVDPESAVITLDGAPIKPDAFGSEMRVEPGPHVIEYRSGGKPQTKTIAIERGGSREVTLDIKPEPEPSQTGKPEEPDKPEVPSPGRGRRIAGFVLMGVGVASLGGAGYLTFDARDKYNAALDAHCMGAKNMCNEEGLRLTSDARGRANLATVFALAGVAAAAGGLVLYLTAPSAGSQESLSRDSEALNEGLYVAPVLGEGGGGLVFGGRY